MSRDGLPEHYEYRDTGCEVAPRCLECPLPECRYIDGRVSPPPIHVERNAQIVALRAQGVPLLTIAATVGKSKRQVLRVLASARQ